MISILTITYNRPHWWDWLFHQVDKQTHQDWEHIVVDGGRDRELFSMCSRRPRTAYAPCQANIPLQRNRALQIARGDWIVWFDDDDWQNPDRLRLQSEMQTLSYGLPMANRWSVVVDASRPTRCERQGYEPFIFNSAAVDRDDLTGFNELLSVDEDVDWVRRLPSEMYTIWKEPLFAWMSHGSNVTNSTRGRLFEERCSIPFDQWELAALRRISGELPRC